MLSTLLQSSPDPDVSKVSSGTGILCSLCKNGKLYKNKGSYRSHYNTFHRDPKLKIKHIQPFACSRKRPLDCDDDVPGAKRYCTSPADHFKSISESSLLISNELRIINNVLVHMEVNNKHTTCSNLCVYLIQARGTGIYRLGTSVNLGHRIVALQRANTFPIHLIWCLSTPRASELCIALQTRFSMRMHSSNWFSLTDHEIKRWSGTVDEESIKLTSQSIQ